jgi:DNA-binding transcriptional LysR family regulator
VLAAEQSTLTERIVAILYPFPLDMSRLDLNSLRLFVEVVERASFTAAGKALGIPKSRLSRRIAQLEEQLATRLLQRTSRRVSLTDVGRAFYAHCQAMMAEADAAHQTVLHRLAEPSGVVRASMPVAVAELVLAQVLPAFLTRHAKVSVTLQATDRRVDLLEEGMDVVIRGEGALPEPGSLVRSPLCSTPWSLVASPAYLEARPRLRRVEDLSRCEALLYQPGLDADAVWRLHGPDSAVQTVAAPTRLRSDNLPLLKQAALADLGIAGLPLYSCHSELSDGRLMRILPEWRPRCGRLSILFPERRGMAPAVRAFIDFLKAELPPLLGPLDLSNSR